MPSRDADDHELLGIGSALGDHRHRRVRHEQRLRRRGIRAALDAQAGQGNRPAGLVPAHRPLRGSGALAPPDEGGARGARRGPAAHRADGRPADRRDDGHRHRAQSVHGAADLQDARKPADRGAAQAAARSGDAAENPRREASDAEIAKLAQFRQLVTTRFDKFFTMGNPPDYEPGPEKSVAAIAARDQPHARRSRLRLHGRGRTSISTSRW